MDYFVESNGSAGHVDFIESNYGQLKRFIKLYDYPRSLMERIVNQISIRAQEEGREYDIIHHCIDALQTGIIVGEYGLLGMPSSAMDDYTLSGLIDRGEYETSLQKAYACFAQAKKIHDEWEQVYIQKTDFVLLNQLTEKVMKTLIGEKQLSKTGSRKDRFFGAATVDGAKDYINVLTKTVGKRYFIKGRPGTGKSTFLKKIAEYALNRGFDAEIYHCSFDPGSLDMIILRELDLCLFDSTSPHEYFPVRETDEVIDIYEIAVAPGTDEENAEQISAFSSAYKQAVGEATAYVCEAKRLLDEADARIMPLLDPILIEKKVQTIMDMMFET